MIKKLYCIIRITTGEPVNTNVLTHAHTPTPNQSEKRRQALSSVYDVFSSQPCVVHGRPLLQFLYDLRDPREIIIMKRNMYYDIEIQERAYLEDSRLVLNKNGLTRVREHSKVFLECSRKFQNVYDFMLQQLSPWICKDGSQVWALPSHSLCEDVIFHKITDLRPPK